jgi:hypothetical protein
MRLNNQQDATYNLRYITQGCRGKWQLIDAVKAQRDAEETQRKAEAAAANLPEPDPKQYIWRREQYVWNKNFISQTSTMVFWHHQTGSVVWIYSNSADNRRRAHYGEEGEFRTGKQ